jgi:Fe2+ transport system protein FeoA
MHSLLDLAAGAEATLSRLGGARSFQRRLMEMGLFPGTRVRLIRKNDIGGVVELEVRRCRMTLRKHDASELRVAFD